MLEKETLVEVLNYAKCPELPAPLKKNEIWVRAIAKVKKANNHETMCLVENDGEGNPIIKKDFGSLSIISSFEEIYPLSLLSSNMLPDFRKKKDLGLFLKQHGYNPDEVDALVESKEDEDKATLKRLVIKICVQNQLSRELHDLKVGDTVEQTTETITDKEENDGTEDDDKSEINGEDSEEAEGEKAATDSEQ